MLGDYCRRRAVEYMDGVCKIYPLIHDLCYLTKIFGRKPILSR